MRKSLFALLLSCTLLFGVAVAQEEPAPDPNAQSQEQQADPNAQAPAEQPADQPAEDDAEALPQTASPLPLLALLGIGGLVGGVAARRK